MSKNNRSKKRSILFISMLLFLSSIEFAIPVMNSSTTSEIIKPGQMDTTYYLRFMELFNDIQTKGYLSPDGVPYHTVETLLVEAPDYGHLTTSEASSFLAGLGATYGRLTGDWSYYTDAWDMTENYMIPQDPYDQPGTDTYPPGDPAMYAPEQDLPSDYPNIGDDSAPTGVDPIFDDLQTTYGTGSIYQMHWLLDVDNWYGYGNHGDGTSRNSFINTYQRGPQESVWETVPHPSWEDYSWGTPDGGFLPLFGDFGAPAQQWRYTSASDADARQIQQSYWALKWAQEQGIESQILAETSNAAKMGDYLRYTMFDKYFRPIAIDSNTAGTGYDSAHYLLSWYSSWGGDLNGAWSWRIGSSHSHQGYQNLMAAYALTSENSMRPLSSQGYGDWQTSLERQLEFYEYLQSAEGAIAGGVTNSWAGRYDPYPAGISTFYDMAYDWQPVYHDPPSNSWFGFQTWSMERVVEYYLETGDPRAKAICEKWINWAVDNTLLYADGTFQIPSTLEWSGQPDTWTGTPTGNPDLHVTVDHGAQFGAGVDIGISACLAKSLIKYAAATQKWDGVAHEPAQITGKEIIDRMWELYRDPIGIACPEGRPDYSRFFDEVYIPPDYSGVNAQGATIQNGMTFIDMRPKYLEDPDWQRVSDAINAGETPEMTYHRFWAQADAAMAYATYHMYFIDSSVPTPPAAPTGVTANAISPTQVDLSWNANTESDIISYRVYRSTNPGFTPDITNKIADVTSISYSDTNAIPNINLYYAITAVNELILESDPTEVVVKTPPDISPPNAPTGFLAIPLNYYEILIDWNDNTESDFATYILYRDGIEITQTAVSEYLDTGLTAGTTYVYELKAVDTSGNDSPMVQDSASTNEIIIALRGQYRCGEATSPTQNIRPYFQILNDDEATATLSDISLRYWFTSEIPLNEIQHQFEYVAVNAQNVYYNLGDIGDHQYLEVGFETTATVPNYMGNPDNLPNALPGDAYTGDVQMRLTDPLNRFIQTNDYSFDPSITSSYADSLLITVYYQDQLVWGKEPGFTNPAPIIDHPADISYDLGTTGHTITWTATDIDPDTYTITLDGTVVDSGNWISGSSITINVDGLSLGENLYTIVVNDQAGKSATDVVKVTVIADGAPIIDHPADISYDLGTTGHTITWTATDIDPDTYIITLDGTNADSGTWISGSPISINVDGLSLGDHLYTIVVSDQAGNVVTDIVEVTVTDTGTPWDLGDVNHDGIVDIIDALLISQYSVEIEPPSWYLEQADVNEDNTVNIVDALLVAQYYVGIIPSLPPP